MVETSGHPVVLAEWLGAPGAPTILVYAHYDVQPAGDESAWESPPFEATVRDGCIYGRGTSDDKGPLLVALEVAEAFWRRDGALPLNVRFLVEGEEEVGSVGLPPFLEAHRDELVADLVLSADGAMWRATEPSIPIAAKGLLALDITVEGPSRDLHSGRHGGAVQNPLRALAAILAGLHTPDGAVAVSGFYDDVLPLSLVDREALAHAPFDEDAYREDVGVEELHGEPGFTTLERLWARPTLEVNGVRGGGSYTVIPHAAHAHVTCRLVPNQRPERIAAAIEEHVLGHCPHGVRGTVVAHAAPSRRTRSQLTIQPSPRRRRRFGASTHTRSRCSCASAAHCRRQRCSSARWATRRSSSRSRLATTTCTGRTSAFASPGCTPASAPGRSSGCSSAIESDPARRLPGCVRFLGTLHSVVVPP